VYKCNLRFFCWDFICSCVIYGDNLALLNKQEIQFFCTTVYESPKSHGVAHFNLQMGSLYMKNKFFLLLWSLELHAMHITGKSLTKICTKSVKIDFRFDSSILHTMFCWVNTDATHVVYVNLNCFLLFMPYKFLHITSNITYLVTFTRIPIYLCIQ